MLSCEIGRSHATCILFYVNDEIQFYCTKKTLTLSMCINQSMEVPNSIAHFHMIFQLNMSNANRLKLKFKCSNA